jgi:hypothetical protein
MLILNSLLKYLKLRSRWKSIFKQIFSNVQTKNIRFGTIIFTMAGNGLRFKDGGYKDIKPLIKVSGKPMGLISSKLLPKALKTVFIFLAESKGIDRFVKILKTEFKNPIILYLKKSTNGQATTAYLSLKKLKELNVEIFEPITFAPCDSGVIFSNQRLLGLLDETDTDIIVWSSRGHVNAIEKPNMYGWINEANNVIKSISVKKPFKNTKKVPIALGIFTFKKIEFFEKPYLALLKKKKTINGEYYIDSLINEAINLGIKCKVFDVSHYVSWGTPKELHEYEYWENIFRTK